MKELNKYINEINEHYKTGQATEHTYRGGLQSLLKELTKGRDITVINEPQRCEFGAPDYILTDKNKIPLLWIEAKDIGKNLDNKNYTEQFDRYKNGFNNVIITDYLEFRFYQNNEFIDSIKIAQIDGDKIISLKNNFEKFKEFINIACNNVGLTIKNTKDLSKIMASRAKIIAHTLEVSLQYDKDNKQPTELFGHYESFKQILIENITIKEFADVYSQTIAYGMFAGRYNDESLGTFSRQEASNLIPKTNPFLRKLFQYIAGYDLDKRILWSIESMADIFRSVDLKAIMYSKEAKEQDPIIHFYEDFLADYDPKLRKQRGVWYTPNSVVKFIVKAVDDILINNFNLSKGLAEDKKIEVEIENENGKGKIKKQMHKVQVLDPATGTGTFLSSVIDKIYSKFKNQKGMWDSYVAENLIPRINGFEILMASYAMAHLKMGIKLKETGYKNELENRFKIYLTNSLEQTHKTVKEIPFANWLTQEAKDADEIKKEAPIMVVVGNPPYSGTSYNNGKWITDLIDDYKKEDTGEKLKERNPKWLNDDYVKFIRYGQEFVKKNKEGILAYINNHSFLDNPTFRGMRYSLLKEFDEIYIIDLHGNSKKKETCPNGSKDENVFDIMQGVSINIFIKKSLVTEPAEVNSKKIKNTNNLMPVDATDLATIFHYDLYGKREAKYQFLDENNLKSIKWNKLQPQSPNYFFIPKDFSNQKEYEKGFKVNELFKVNSTGIITKKDKVTIHLEKKEIENIVNDFIKLSENELTEKHQTKDSRDWKVSYAKKDIIKNKDKDLYTKIQYRPFDIRHTFYTSKTKGFMAYPVNKVMQHFLEGENLGLVFNRQIKTNHISHIFITDYITDLHILETANASANIAPLYLYPDKNHILEQKEENRNPNLDSKIVEEFLKNLKVRFVNEEEQKETDRDIAPVDILDYIYGVLHNPKYREEYKEFLKIDFPRVPYPKDEKEFLKYKKIGAELRALHLMEENHPAFKEININYPKEGNNIIEKPKFVLKKENKQIGKVYINDNQYFENVPKVAWEFFIGGYQPAQKWLKDRKDKILSYDDIVHYQKIIIVLRETERIMRGI